MPRQARIDAPGALHHIMARGIERSKIFRNNYDRDGFLERLGGLINESQTQCYAWALMPNHFHLLLKTGKAPIATLMRRLMTGYAVSFNRRYRRHGHLFQNRYKSILCDQDEYLKELVRYIHLNPLRAGIVKHIRGLNIFKYSGHSAIMGKYKVDWQNVKDILALFGDKKGTARRMYGQFVEQGAGHGRRPDLMGGGLIRSVGGWRGVKELRKSNTFFKSDERILGGSDFVETVLGDAEEAFERRFALSALGVDFDVLLRCVSEQMSMVPEEILMPGKARHKVQARSLLCFWASRELGTTMTFLSGRLNCSVSGVSIAVQRGEKLVREKGLKLDDLLKL
jgi:putative transposase